MKFLIPRRFKESFDSLTEKYTHEFTLFGKTRVEGEDVYLENIFVPEQESTMGDTEVSPDNLFKFMDELLTAKEDPKNWNMWIHSHHTMGAFWSGTDKAQMDSFNMGQQYFFHMVISTKGFKGALSMYKPFAMFLDDITIEYIDDEGSNPEMTALETQIEALMLQLETLKNTPSTLTTTILAQLDTKNKIKSYSYTGWSNEEREEWWNDRNKQPLPLNPGSNGSSIVVAPGKKRYKQLKKLSERHGVSCACETCVLVELYEHDKRLV